MLDRGKRMSPPLVRVPLEPIASTGETAAVDPEFTVHIPQGTVFLVSVAVADTTQGAIVVFRGGANASTDGFVVVGAELGTTKYIAPFRIGTVKLNTGAAGGWLSVWIDDDSDIDRC
jgi:hypothetical protein